MIKVLLDNCVDGRFAADLTECEVVHARAVGWEKLQNGELLRSAEEAGFDVLVTVDKQMRHQQNMKGRHISLVTIVTRFVTYPDVKPLASKFASHSSTWRGALQSKFPRNRLVPGLSACPSQPRRKQTSAHIGIGSFGFISKWIAFPS